MPQYTEARIQQLCKEILAAQDEEDFVKLVPELRLAIEEHIRLAKDSLSVQRFTIASHEAATRSKPDRPDQ